MRLTIPTLILTTSLLINITSATANDEPNLREICRKRVAGLYLKCHDETKLAEQMLLHNKKSIKQHQKALKENQKKLHEIQVLSEKMPYDSKRFHLEQSLKQKINLLKENLNHYKAEQKKIRKNTTSLQSKRLNLKNKIKKVFNFEKRDASIFGYPFQIMWKSSCPKWRLSCPLKRNTAQKLLNIWTDAVPSSCHKYSNMIH